jgi:LysM repeat protein
MVETATKNELLGIKVPRFFAENGLAAFNFLQDLQGHLDDPSNNNSNNKKKASPPSKPTPAPKATSEPLEVPKTTTTSSSTENGLPPKPAPTTDVRVVTASTAAGSPRFKNIKAGTVSAVAEESKTESAKDNDSPSVSKRLLSVICPIDIPMSHHFHRSSSIGSGSSKQNQQQQQQFLSESDWELLSDRASSVCSLSGLTNNNNNGGGAASFVVRGPSGQASVISFNSSTSSHGAGAAGGAVGGAGAAVGASKSSGGNGNGNGNGGGGIISGFLLHLHQQQHPFRQAQAQQQHQQQYPNGHPPQLKRTASSSTIDSQDNVLGPSGKGVLGVDYVEHIVQPTDTLQGICIAYHVSASSLRRANHFTGYSLQLAPKKLLIPLSQQALRTGFIREKETDSKEHQLNQFLSHYPEISYTEAKA